MPLVILGVGNLLMSDDGVGVHAARAMAADPPDGAVVREVGTAVFDALSVLERARSVIAIDAVDAGEPPGTIVQFDLDAGERVDSPPSLHAFDLPALVRALPPGRRPRVHVVGMQPAVVELGLELSPAVAARLPALIAAIRAVAGSPAFRPGTPIVAGAKAPAYTPLYLPAVVASAFSGYNVTRT